jgi:hypothetical protein
MKQLLVICTIGIIMLSGCTSKVKPWEKGILAEKHMQLGGGDAPSKKINEHVFTSKEGSFGGGGIGGGGCGCN